MYSHPADADWRPKPHTGLTQDVREGRAAASVAAGCGGYGQRAEKSLGLSLMLCVLPEVGRVPTAAPGAFSPLAQDVQSPATGCHLFPQMDGTAPNIEGPSSGLAYHTDGLTELGQALVFRGGRGVEQLAQASQAVSVRDEHSGLGTPLSLPGVSENCHL